MSEKTYILDGGHGLINPLTKEYVTPGKRSGILPDGSVYYEGVGNRDIAVRVAAGLKKLNFSFDFTVRPEIWTDVALHTRAKAADNLIAKSGKPGVLISIHSNGFTDPLANGYEVFTSPGQTASDKYADVAFAAFKEDFPDLKPRPDMSDGDVDKEAKFAILLLTKCPAILIESMFHTNPKEVAILNSGSGRQRIANTIIKAIQRMDKL